MPRRIPLALVLCLAASTGELRSVDLLFDFEGDRAPGVRDKLTDDGAQDGRMVQNVRIETEDVPFGQQAARFEPPDVPEPPEPEPGDAPDLYSTLEIPGTRALGSSWTLSAFVEFSADGLTRLFSSYQGTGGLEEDRILVDIDPSGGAINFLRVIIGTEILEALDFPVDLFEPGFQHFALSFSEGVVFP